MADIYKPWLTFTGRSLAQELGNGWSEGVHHDDFDRCTDVCSSHFVARKEFRVQYRLRRHDGAYRWIDDSAIPRFSPDGTFLGCIGSAFDIHEYRQIESDKAPDSDRLVVDVGGGIAPWQLINALPAAVYVTDAQGRITYFNEAAARLWGCRPKLGSDQWCGSWRLYWLDGTPMPHDECPMAITLKQGSPVQGGMAIAERPDGTRVPFMAFPTPLRDASGALFGAVNMLIDISERQRAERVERRLAAIVESSHDAIISKDLNGVITTWNRAAERLFGYSAAEAIGRPITMLIPSDRENEEVEILGRIGRGERIDHFETMRRRKDGSLINTSLSVSP